MIPNLKDIYNEIKIQAPGGISRTSFDNLKEAILEHELDVANHLNFEDPDAHVDAFQYELDKIQNNELALAKIQEVYKDFGWGDDEFLILLKKLFII